MKRLGSTTKDLEESHVDKSIEAAQESSGKSEDDELEITTEDLGESYVDKSWNLLRTILKFLT